MQEARIRRPSVGAFMISVIRIGFGGILYYKTMMRNPQSPVLILNAPILGLGFGGFAHIRKAS